MCECTYLFHALVFVVVHVRWLMCYHLTIVVAHNIDITIYEAEITSIEDRLKGYSKPPLMGTEPPTPSFERSFITALTGD